MEKIDNNAGQGLGIAALVIGILSLLIAFIPCLGVFAIVPGCIAIILSAFGLNSALKNNGSKDLNIAALIISILSTLIAILWLSLFTKVTDIYDNGIDSIANDFVEEVLQQDDDLKNEIEQLNIHLDSLEVDSVNLNQID